MNKLISLLQMKSIIQQLLKNIIPRLKNIIPRLKNIIPHLQRSIILNIMKYSLKSMEQLVFHIR